MKKLLILGGTTEASSLAAALAGDARFNTLVSFAGTTRAPRPPPVAFRIGGFGGAAGLAAYLRDSGTDLVIDATHPFATTMKRNAVLATCEAGVPLLGVFRPQWQPGLGDRWTRVPTMAAAAQALGKTPRVVLLTIGQKDLAAFKAAPWHRYIVRSVDPPSVESLPPDATVIAARGPFVEADEIALLRAFDISMIVTKNSGGGATHAKLDAARICGVSVVMVDRPTPPEGIETVEDAMGALVWLDRHAGTERGV